jgi:hypothetical protein
MDAPKILRQHADQPLADFRHSTRLFLRRQTRLSGGTGLEGWGRGDQGDRGTETATAWNADGFRTPGSTTGPKPQSTGYGTSQLPM